MPSIRNCAVLIAALWLTGCSSGLRLTDDGVPLARNEKHLASVIDDIITDTGMDPAWWGIHVVRISDGAVLYSRESDRSYMPASNTKLYSTAAGLVLLGPEFRYETRLYADGPVVNDTLRGNLFVRGAGDPAIGGRFRDGDRTLTFRNWASDLKEAGIHMVEGDVIGDDNLFDDLPLGSGWSWDDEPYKDSAEISALSFNDNTVDVSLEGRKPGAAAHLTWEPASTSYVTLVNSSVTTPAGTGVDEEYEKARASNTIYLKSRVAQGRTDFERLSISNPTTYFAHVLTETLAREGVRVTGSPRDVDELAAPPDYGSASMSLVATHRSEPLKTIAAAINKPSQNLYAEMLLKTIGVHANRGDSDAEPGTAAAGMAAARLFFGSAGVDTTRFRLVDGSGMSRYNLVSPEMTTALLTHMGRAVDDSTRAAFYRSLPIAGVDGTLSSRMKSGPAHNNARAKTGTLNNASALSGYVDTSAGTRLAFSIMGNHYILPTSRARNVQDRIVQALAAYER